MPIVLLRLSQDKKVIAIGEIGLDYYYSADNKALQQTVFADQIRIANEVDKTRDYSYSFSARRYHCHVA